MALIVEDGTGRADAESYISVAQADAYHRALGREADWLDLDTGDKEIALRNAAKFMIQIYRARWAGARVRYEQRLDWPRYGVTADRFAVPSTIVPVDVQEACAELALRSANGEELLPDLDAGSNVVKRDKVGPLETEFFQSTVDARERFASVEAVLMPYFGTAGGGNMIKLVRA